MRGLQVKAGLVRLDKGLPRMQGRPDKAKLGQALLVLPDRQDLLVRAELGVPVKRGVPVKLALVWEALQDNLMQGPAVGWLVSQVQVWVEQPVQEGLLLLMDQLA